MIYKPFAHIKDLSKFCGSQFSKKLDYDEEAGEILNHEWYNIDLGKYRYVFKDVHL